MTKILSCLVCVFLVVMAVSVWQQLTPKRLGERLSI